MEIKSNCLLITVDFQVGPLNFIATVLIDNAFGQVFEAIFCRRVPPVVQIATLVKL
jgi:hypothetical protein